MKKGEPFVTLDTFGDYRELIQIKMEAKETGLIILGGGVPKNALQDTTVGAEIAFGVDAPMHKYAVQISLALEQDGGCSGSTMDEAESWRKTKSQTGFTCMLFQEITSALPIIASAVYYGGAWKDRPRRNHAKLFL